MDRSKCILRSSAGAPLISTSVVLRCLAQSQQPLYKLSLRASHDHTTARTYTKTIARERGKQTASEMFCRERDRERERQTERQRESAPHAQREREREREKEDRPTQADTERARAAHLPSVHAAATCTRPTLCARATLLPRAPGVRAAVADGVRRCARARDVHAVRTRR